MKTPRSFTIGGLATPKTVLVILLFLSLTACSHTKASQSPVQPGPNTAVNTPSEPTAPQPTADSTPTQQKDTQVARMIELTEEDDGVKLENVRAGDTLRVTLAANLSTGFTWVPSNLDAGVFKLLGEPVYKSDPGSLIGSGGKMTFEFRVLKTGTSVLRLVYRRPFEKGVMPIRSFEVTFVVR